ncbi:MAG: IS200/IS605 family transposase [Bacteroidota bacterium]|nr:IS200/IS605 family transposase [Bacteroidota bacterium]MDP4233818.1 IS200/IS605 family transposase [Bacteroidota bacterium]MDP4242483.1 IS200/IS605 family transposase [Bacteroidota bacterium]MDP4289039.1 IS200/IS605 family transposase [Bacteroidota bacterium]
MANTYAQLYIHLVFAVKNRQCLIPREHKDELQKYITGIVKNKKHKLIAIENEPDHIHVLVGLKPDQSISDLVKDIKTGSSLWLNEQPWMPKHFNWQDGFGAFSYSRSQLDHVIAYIRNQGAHHKKQNFREEYIAILKAFGIEFDERYLFDFLEGA